MIWQLLNFNKIPIGPAHHWPIDYQLLLWHDQKDPQKRPVHLASVQTRKKTSSTRKRWKVVVTIALRGLFQKIEMMPNHRDMANQPVMKRDRLANGMNPPRTGQGDLSHLTAPIQPDHRATGSLQVTNENHLESVMNPPLNDHGLQNRPIAIGLTVFGFAKKRISKH